MEHSPGGLAAALRGLRGSHVWVGWPGAPVPPEYEIRVGKRLATEGLHPVFLSAEEEDGFYHRTCNDSIWPLFHYLPGRFSFSQDAWSRYVDVNERFADAIAELCTPGCRVWVHDFQLMLVPEALRRRRPDVSIGFFLHIPFPSSEIYRLLPAREQVLRGLLGADYVSFHIGDYARHFRSSLLRVLGIDSEPDVVEHRRASRRHRRRPDRHRRRELPRDTRGSRDGTRPGRDRGALRGPPADPRCRASRLHEGDPTEAPGLRAFPRAGPGAREDDDDAPDPRPVTAGEAPSTAASATRSSCRSHT